MEWMSILRLMLQTPISDQHSSRDKALDRQDDSQLLAQSECLSILRVIFAHTYSETTTAAETSHLIDKMPPNSYQFSARNDAIVIRGVHDMDTDTSTETRKVEGKLDTLMNLVTQLAANQKPASVARVCGIRSSNDHHTSVCPPSQQSGLDEHPEAYAANTYSRPPEQQTQGT
ncbi:hypothetical protein Fmac_032900 [Flemingia macrophylla]|uniref:Uncharacterized protein n=1 Tax=Flemingia macrophylla TaxID=520843 RepID=A0ABD1L694_9FABA